MFLGRVVKPGEPEWTEDDRAWARALLAEERDACPGCGEPLSETLDPANAEDYTVDSVGGCAGCYVLAAKRKGEPPERLWAVRRMHRNHQQSE